MKTKNMRKKALLSSLAMLLVAVVALSAATYAWFTNSQKASISTINVTAAQASGLQISATGATGTWGTNLDPTGTVPTTFVPSSSVDTSTFFSGGIGEDGLLTASDVTIAGDTESTTTSVYMKNVFYLKTDAETATLKFDALSVQVGEKNLSESVRFALVYQGTADVAAVTDSTTFDGTASTTIYEPKATSHSTSGASGTILTTMALNQAVTSVDPGAVPAESTTAQVTVTDAAAGTEIVTLPQGISKMVLYIWLEGQDVDCINGAAGDNIDVDISFTI